MNQPQYSTHKQNGIALITVMLVFVAVSIITYAVLGQLKNTIQRTTTLSEQTQAYHYALGAEELARQVIAEDIMTTPGVIYPAQQWSQLREGLPVSNCKISITIEDLQGRFNLNTLLAPNTAAIKSFQRLLASLDIKANSTSIISALSQLSIGSASTNGTLVDDVSALKIGGALQGDEYERLLPYVAVLPDNDNALNLNTASALLIKAYLPNENTYNRIMDLRTKQGFLSPKDIPTIPGMEGLTVKSDYFGVTSKVLFNGQKLKLYSVIRKRNGASGLPELKVISRELGNF